MLCRTSHIRADQGGTSLVHITEDDEYRDAPGVPGPALNSDTPEISLLCAFLERAILDLGGRGNEKGTYDTSTTAHALDAFEWVADPTEDVWSFTWVCDHLLLSVSATRQRIFVLATQLRRTHATRTNGGWHAPEHRRPT